MEGLFQVLKLRMCVLPKKSGATIPAPAEAAKNTSIAAERTNLLNQDRRLPVLFSCPGVADPGILCDVLIDRNEIAHSEIMNIRNAGYPRECL